MPGGGRTDRSAAAGRREAQAAFRKFATTSRRKAWLEKLDEMALEGNLTALKIRTEYDMGKAPVVKEQPEAGDPTGDDMAAAAEAARAAGVTPIRKTSG